jgi:hypothetical protein
VQPVAAGRGIGNLRGAAWSQERVADRCPRADGPLELTVAAVAAAIIAAQVWFLVASLLSDLRGNTQT